MDPLWSLDNLPPMGADGLRRGVPSLNVIGEIDLLRSIGFLLIRADVVVAGPDIVLHRMREI